MNVLQGTIDKCLLLKIWQIVDRVCSAVEQRDNSPFPTEVRLDIAMEIYNTVVGIRQKRDAADAVSGGMLQEKIAR